MDSFKFDTKLIHSGEPKPPIGNAVAMPIFQSVTYLYSGQTDYNDLKYIRLNNTPNHEALAKKLATLECGEDALVTASGMAAITTSLLALVGEGEHLLAQEGLYGGTWHFLEQNFPKFGRRVTFFTMDQVKNLPSLIQPKTKAIYVESVSNPLLQVIDFKQIVSFAKANKLTTLIDNTFPSPVNFNPISVGFDVVLHSATKYLNGHTDIAAGAVVSTREIITKITALLNHLGGSMDPHTCFLLHRGLKTLGVRVRHQNETALKLARALEKTGRVGKVNYPGLESNQDHARAREFFRGFGGMISFEYRGTVSELESALKRLTIPYIAPSLGGVETLVTRPVTTSHSGMRKEELDRAGIKDTLVRVSVGLEDPDDLINDFSKALG